MIEILQRLICSYSWLDHRTVKKILAPVQGKVLDVGCGQKRLKPYLSKECEYVGIDFSASADIHMDITKERYPFPDATFDFAICNAVLEHVEDEHFVLREIHRVLKPGGKLYVSIPFMQPYHADPEDYRRFTSYGLGHLLEKHGFKLLEVPGTAFGTLLTIEYFIFAEVVETIKRRRWINPVRWLYLAVLFVVYTLCKVGTILFYSLQKNDIYVSPSSQYLCVK